MTKCVSPWYNHTGWLDVTPVYLLLNLININSSCVNLDFVLFINKLDKRILKTIDRGTWSTTVLVLLIVVILFLAVLTVPSIHAKSEFAQFWNWAAQSGDC